MYLCNRGAEAFEAHLSEQFDVFFVVAVEIDRFVIRVIFTRFDLVGDFARYAVRPASQHVADARAFAVFIPAAFNLMRGDRAAPQKSLGRVNFFIFANLSE